MEKEIEGGFWYYNPTKTRSNRKDLYSQHRSLLYKVLYRGVTKHHLRDGFWLLELLPKCTTADCYVVFRYIMIMINTLETRMINKNFIIYLESLLSKLNISKPDVFIEFMSYLISNNRIDDARELFCLRHRFMSYLIHRNVPLMSSSISCYGLLLNYVEWKEAEKQVEFDVSIQGWLVNGMDPLKSVEHNYELFIMCIVEVLLYYGFWKKGYLFVSEFQRSNPDNLAAQLLLYNLIESLTSNNGPKRRRMLENNKNLNSSEGEEARERYRNAELSAINNFSGEECKVPLRPDNFPITTDKKNIMDRLGRLDPTRDELIDLSAIYSEKTETIKLIMNSLEHVSKIKDPSRWRCLQEYLDEVISSNDPILVGKVANLWQMRYKQFWRVESFIFLANDGKPENRIKHQRLIKSVIQTLTTRFDRCDEFHIAC